MITFDNEVIRVLHNLSQTSPGFTNLMELLSNNDFLGSGLVVSLLWFFWFQPAKKQAYKRDQIILVILGTLLAIIIGRFLTNILPFRLRPVLNSNLAGFFPNKLIGNDLSTETSMPSDHAVLFFSLAMGIYFISKKAGIFAFFYVALFCFARVYLGLHFASDILVGAIIGIITQLLFAVSAILNKRITKKVLVFSSNFPGFFYLLFFIITCQIGTMFDSSRKLLHYIFNDLLHIY